MFDVSPTGFVDVTAERDVGVVQHGMGCDIGDVDGDGLDEIYTTDVHQNHLLHPLPDGTFVDATQASGLRGLQTGMSWGARIVDVDNDGNLDLVVAEGDLWPAMDPTPLPTGYIDGAVRRFSLTLTDAQYRAVLAVADKWRNWPQPSYDIDEHNCVLFVKDLAQTVGLTVSDDPKFVRDPIGFLGDVAARNATLLAQYGNPPVALAPQADGAATLQQRVRQLEQEAGR